ncbi:MAG: DUF362 domain-containing protein [Asgard group archaeon]|nr:DUF362 domain-containing protein [Asgard group archaeon]
MSLVVVKTEVDLSNLDKNVSDALKELNFEIKDNDIITIKPNLCDYRPSEQGGTTDPLVVEAVIKYIRTLSNCPINIVESDHALAIADDEFERMGYLYLEKEYENVKVINLTKEKHHRLYLGGFYFDEFSAPEVLLKTTKLVNVAKLKTHTQTKITCILKNQFGLVSRRYKKRYHPFLSEVILDLIKLFPPTLSIIDGLVAMEGSGPSDGDRRDSKILICGNDPVTTDIIAARVMGIKPLTVPVIKLAKKKKVSNLKYNLIGTLPKLKFKHMPWYSYLMRRYGLNSHKRAARKYAKKKKRSEFYSDVAAGFLVLKQGNYSTLQSGLIDRQIFFRVFKGMLKRPFVRIKLKLKGI